APGFKPLVNSAICPSGAAPATATPNPNNAASTTIKRVAYPTRCRPGMTGEPNSISRSVGRDNCREDPLNGSIASNDLGLGIGSPYLVPAQETVDTTRSGGSRIPSRLKELALHLLPNDERTVASREAVGRQTHGVSPDPVWPTSSIRLG